MNRYILVGTPNCGKTTIFNAITGLKEKGGNWHGVTATAKKGVYISKNNTFELLDLPGIYSLKTYSCEESVTVDYLLKESYTAIILVVDATSPYGASRLLQELLPLNKKIILLFNKTQKTEIDRQKLIDLRVVFYEINPYKTKSVLSFADNLSNLKFNYNSLNLDCFKSAKQPFYDRYLLNWYVFLPIFFVLVLGSYYLAFSNFFGGQVSKLLSAGIERIADFSLQLKLTDFLSSIIFKTINSLGGVISLIPQVVILQFCLFMLEESGLSLRFCVITYNLLAKLGLSGKSLFPLISSLGCGAVSCKLCNACENQKIKDNTLKLLPFIPCSAKNSVVIFICLKTFKKPYLVLVLAYLVLILITLCYAFFSQKIKKVQKESMFLELVDLSFPNIKKLFLELLNTLCDFFKKIITTCLVISFALAIFTSVTPYFSIAQNIEDSLLCFICKKFAFVLKPIGFSDWKILLALLLGLFAKEGVISTICALYPSGFSLSFTGGILLIFIVLIYPPCLTNLVAFGKEKKRLGFIIFIKHTLFAYLGAVLLKILLTKPLYFCIITLLVIGAFLVYERIYLPRKRKTKYNFAKTKFKLFFNTIAIPKKRYKGKR